MIENVGEFQIATAQTFAASRGGRAGGTEDKHFNQTQSFNG